MITNHWGVYVDSETPVPGVISFNKISHEFLDEDICPTCEEMYQEVEEMQDCPECDALMDGDECPECGWDKQKEYDFMECEDHQKLYGDWIKKDGLYEPDENGEFAAIYSPSFNDLTVIWSKFIKKNVALCSPCAPGQASIDSFGDYTCYTLPDYLLEEDE